MELHQICPTYLVLPIVLLLYCPCTAVLELERSLMELHQIFLDMAVLVEAQGEMLDNIEAQVGSWAVMPSPSLQPHNPHPQPRCTFLSGPQVAYSVDYVQAGNSLIFTSPPNTPPPFSFPVTCRWPRVWSMCRRAPPTWLPPSGCRRTLASGCAAASSCCSSLPQPSPFQSPSGWPGNLAGSWFGTHTGSQLARQAARR